MHSLSPGTQTRTALGLDHAYTECPPPALTSMPRCAQSRAWGLGAWVRARHPLGQRAQFLCPLMGWPSLAGFEDPERVSSRSSQLWAQGGCVTDSRAQKPWLAPEFCDGCSGVSS